MKNDLQRGPSSKGLWIIQKGVLPSHTGRLSCSKNIWPFKAASSEKKALWRPKHRPAGRPRQAMPTPLWKQSWEKFQWKQLDKERCCRCRTNEEGRCSVVLVQPSPTSSRQLLFWQTAKAFLVRGGAGNYTTGALRPKWGYHIKQWGCHSGAVEQNYSAFILFCCCSKSIVVSPIKWENIAKCIGIQNEKSLKFDDYYSVGRPKIRYWMKMLKYSWMYAYKKCS